MDLSERAIEWSKYLPHTSGDFVRIPVQCMWEYMALAEESPHGAFVEIGAYRGGSAYMLSCIVRKQKRDFYVYDTFTGIPCVDEIDRHKVGDFSDTDYDNVCEMLPDATVTKGLFPFSIIRMPPIAFALLDVDQYQSTKESLQAILPLMVDGGIIVFDDYGALEGATKAVDELLDKDQLLFTDSGKAYVRCGGVHDLGDIDRGFGEEE